MLKLPKIDAVIRVISRLDTGLNTTDPEFDQKYNEYLKNLDESILPIKDQNVITRFIMSTTPSYNEAQSMIAMQFKLKDGPKSIDPNYLLEQVRNSLIRIENGPNVSQEDRIIWKADSDGKTDKNLIAQLHTVGAIFDLFTARINATSSASNVKKN